MDYTIEFKNQRIELSSMQKLGSAIDAALKLKSSKINILFSTLGGEIHPALEFNKMLMKHPPPIDIVIYNTDSVISSGIVVFLSFEKRYFLPNSKFLIHGVRFEENTIITEEKINQKKSYNEEQIGILNAKASLLDVHIDKVRDTEEDITISAIKKVEGYRLAKYIEKVDFTVNQVIN